MAEIGRVLPSAAVLTGEGAQVATVLSAIERADLVHIAAHGSFRSDSPMLSALELHDGPLTAYDLEQLPRVPPTMVLSACSGARVAARGGETLGTVAVLLARGVVNVVAPTTVLPDWPAAEVLASFYRRVAAGDQVADALASVRADGHGTALTREQLVASVLACFGR